ncbi:hypothetical protein [Nonomuraea gerenzanensis]|uniref:Uncharacterized protein n=1 Tax=Nonomuraea gerenzanensis TaxID=93944 RepID=A0A1M4EFN1_9ACTN|nr:hypothetical protein [Nonomuraea gerenzanensis]UBU09389.1 hypothetical protein LCN96_34115 [Nonomuraea gerenzanensis]SBO97801.1 hypothetical protein BN4615_P7317 [Nonomuraea gerenzanensis]
MSAAPHTQWHRPLMLMVASMLVLLVVSVAGLLLDDRVLQGAPVWLKPFKFAVSLAVYGTTLAWMLSLPHRGRRWTSGLATVFAVAAFVDVGIVALQAARGTYSHFNDSAEPVEETIQRVFGLGVMGLMLANLVLAAILAVQRVGPDRAASRAVHTGLGLAVAGMVLGFLIPFHGTAHTGLTTDGVPVPLTSGHSVGVPDGGPGLPITQWSTTGGDLRVPHFVALHGLQVMLLLALLLAWLAARHPILRDERARARLVGVAATGYAGLVALVTWQAYRGQPLTSPDVLTLGAVALLAGLTTVACGAVLSAARHGEARSGEEAVTR